MPREDYHV